jgi:hypothetical protein
MKPIVEEKRIEQPGPSAEPIAGASQGTKAVEETKAAEATKA